MKFSLARFPRSLFAKFRKRPKTSLALLLAPPALAASGLAYCWYLLPDQFPVQNWQAKADGVRLLDNSGNLIWHVPGSDSYRSSLLPYSAIPKTLIDATLAAEDSRFFVHSGVDSLSLARAIRDNLSSGRVISGASTITQQLAKISSPKSPRNLSAKFRESLQARWLESRLSKTQILEAYLNKLDYGNCRRGPEAASQFYFGRPLDQLSLSQFALLASLPQSPTRLNPVKNPSLALSRRNWILDRMRTLLDYPEDDIRRAKSEPLCLNLPAPSPRYPQLVDQLSRLQPASPNFTTSIDLNLQNFCQAIVEREVNNNRENNLSQAAVVVIDNATGQIKALIGSAFPNDPNGGSIDMSLCPRSAGSTLKPFVYAKFFDSPGDWPGSVIPDIPTSYISSSGLTAPSNYNNHYFGPVTARNALASSLNIPAMRVLHKIGGASVLCPILADLGFSADLSSPEKYGLGMAIGNVHITLLDLANSYAALSRMGQFRPCGFYPTPSQPPSPAHPVAPHPISISPIACYLTAEALSNPLARLSGFGLRSAIDLPFWCAVKTGTSSNYRDNWCAGFTPQFTVAVWCGNPQSRPMDHVSGVSGAGPIFHDIMLELHKSAPPSPPEPPGPVETVEIDLRTGFRIPPDHAISPFNRARFVIPADKSSLADAPSNPYDTDGRVVLDAAYWEWFSSNSNLYPSSFTINPSLWAIDTPKITSPPNGATIELDPNLPSGGSLIRLKSNLPPDAIFSSPTLEIFSFRGKPTLRLKPGTHTIQVVHPGLGISATSKITVTDPEHS